MSKILERYLPIRKKFDAVCRTLWEYYEEQDPEEFSWFLPDFIDVPKGILPPGEFHFDSIEEELFFMTNMVHFGQNCLEEKLVTCYLKEHEVSPDVLPYFKAIEKGKAGIYAVVSASRTGKVVLDDLLNRERIIITDSSLWKSGNVKDLIMAASIVTVNNVSFMCVPVNMGHMDLALYKLCDYYKSGEISDGLIMLSCFYHRGGKAIATEEYEQV